VTTEVSTGRATSRSFYANIRSIGPLTLSAMLLSRTATNIVTDTRSVRAGSVEPEPKSEMSSSFSNRCPLLGIVSDLAYLASSRSARSLSRSSPQMMIFLQPHACKCPFYRDHCGVLIVVVVVMMEKESRCLHFPLLTSANLCCSTVMGYTSVHCIDYREIASDVRKSNHHVIGCRLQLTVNL
jgi:hypothetical protein